LDRSLHLEINAEGKTKIIWHPPQSNLVLIESKDSITAGDGEKRDVIEGKAILATTTTCNCLRLLNRNRIPTHFIEQIDERTFLAKQVSMIPIESVARRIATGSYLKRNPDVAEGTVFRDPVTEFFYKDDQLHDPLMVFDQTEENWKLYDAKIPHPSSHIIKMSIETTGGMVGKGQANCITVLTVRVFGILEQAWAKLGVTLVDLKVEFGFEDSGLLLLADVIDNDSWRIWPEGDKSQMRDKQVYRDTQDRTPEMLAKIKENYAWVAEATSKFLD